jgi:hypothetical protein
VRFARRAKAGLWNRLFEALCLRQVQDAHNCGELLMAGALAEPADRAVLIFRVDGRSPVEEFDRPRHTSSNPGRAVLGLTCCRLLMVRETVAVETPARFATCRMSIVCVIRRLRRTLILVAIARP